MPANLNLLTSIPTKRKESHHWGKKKKKAYATTVANLPSVLYQAIQPLNWAKSK